MKTHAQPADSILTQSDEPSTMASTAGKGRHQVKPRVIFEVTPALLDQIRDRAISQGLTLTAYMLKLLAADGLDTITRPPSIDGRTLRRARLQISD